MQTKTDIENLLRPRLVQDAEKLYPKGTYVYDILRVAYITGRQEQLEDFFKFLKWAGENYDIWIDGEKRWCERTGHDDFETFTDEELYIEYIEYLKTIK